MSRKNIRVAALLPMKGNSERVVGKNFKSFLGKPLFQWILETLRSIQEIDLIVINTDAESILLKNGFFEDEKTVLRTRRKEICGDFISMNQIIEDDIKNIEADVFVMTHTTNPLLSAQTIQNALHNFLSKRGKNECDSLFTVNKLQTRLYTKDCKPINHDPNLLLRTQDLEPLYEENSNLYIFTKESFFTFGARIGKNPTLFETPRQESVDIDDEWSWSLAENFAKILYKT